MISSIMKNRKKLQEKKVDTAEINDTEVEMAEPEMIAPKPETKPDFASRRCN